MNEEIDLIDKMRRLASVVPHEARPGVERSLCAAFRARQPRRTNHLWMYAVAACALLLLGLSFVYQRKVTRRHSNFIYTAPGFIALPYSQSGVPLESAVVIRVAVTRSELASMGVAVPASASTARVNADVLVGQDGVARAVRFVE